MNRVEIKARVDFRLNPLLAKGVRVIYGKAEFSINDYDFFDSHGKYFIYTSDRTDPLEFGLEEIQAFIDSITRKDGIPVPKFNSDGSVAPKVKPAVRAFKAKQQITALDDEEEEIEELPEELNPDEDPDDQKLAPVKNNGAFVHIKSTVDVYVTREYSLFGILKGNRSLNKTKIKRIKDDIAAGSNLLQYCPIIVVEKDGKLVVIDGQHRLEVAKQIHSNIWYVISRELSLYQIAKMNSNTEKWKGKDFINCYAAGGNEDYRTLKNFVAAYSFPLSVSLQLLNKGIKISDGGTDIMEQFQQGKYQVKTEEEATEVAKAVEMFKGFTGRKSRCFVIAICKLMQAKKMPVDEIAKAYIKHSDQLLMQSAWKDYLINIETIVNIGKGKRVVIY